MPAASAKKNTSADLLRLARRELEALLGFGGGSGEDGEWGLDWYVRLCYAFGRRTQDALEVGDVRPPTRGFACI